MLRTIIVLFFLSSVLADYVPSAKGKSTFSNDEILCFKSCDSNYISSTRYLAIRRIPIPTRDRISKAFEDIIFDPKFLLKYVPQKDLFIEK